MNKDRMEGKGKEVAGGVREHAGRMTGNHEMEAKGRSQEGEGKLQGAAGKVKDAAQDLKGAAGDVKDRVMDREKPGARK